MRGILAPLNAVLLTRKNIEEVVDDAVIRGRMTRADAQEMIQSLLSRGARATDDFLADLERMLGAADADSSSAERRTPSARTLPIAGYDELSAAQVQEQARRAHAGRAAQAARLRGAPREPQDRARPHRPQASVAPQHLPDHHAEVEPVAGHLGEQLVGVEPLALAPDRRAAGLPPRGSANQLSPNRSRSMPRRWVSNAHARR